MAGSRLKEKIFYTNIDKQNKHRRLRTNTHTQKLPGNWTSYIAKQYFYLWFPVTNYLLAEGRSLRENLISSLCRIDRVIDQGLR